MTTRVQETLRELFSVDLRSLALLRIGLGMSIVIDLVLRALDLELLYTDQGVLPRDLLLETQGRGAILSIHYWASRHEWLQALVFAANAACALALLVGWRTWLATLACWYFASSLQVRQPLVYMGGDSILRLLLFWGLFLPLDARFSIDAVRGRVALHADRLLSGGTVAFLLQVCLVYWATGIAKNGELWRTGQAVFYALHWEMATPVGVWLRNAPSRLLELTTSGTLAVELFAPFLAFVPFYLPVFRLLTVALFWVFHLGLAAGINIGLFPLFAMVAWLSFIPSEAWERFRPAATRAYVPVRSLGARSASLLAALAITYVVILLAERTHIIPRVLPQPVNTIGWALRLQQTWDMFVPDPPLRSNTFFVRETARDGTTTTVPAADTFRSKLYLGYLVSRPSTERAAASRHFVRHRCTGRNRGSERTRVAHIALLMERREIRTHGYDPATTIVLVSLPCDD